jgi:hypothetical protein
VIVIAHQHPGMDAPARPTARLAPGGPPPLPVPRRRRRAFAPGCRGP